MRSELKELLDIAIFRSGLSRFEVVRLEELLKGVCFVDEFIDDICCDSDTIVGYTIKQYSFMYFMHYLKKDSEKAKRLKAKEMLENEQKLSENDKNLIIFAKNSYANKNEQILFVSQYL